MSELNPTEPFRPANGSMGSIFMSKFCYRCTKDDPDTERYCGILTCALTFRINESEYPDEWIVDVGDPIGKSARCTAFELIGGNE